MTDLKPCPFCGGGAYINEVEEETLGYNTIINYEAGCPCCRIETLALRNKNEVIERWNTRQPAIGWKPIETISKTPEEWLLLRTAKGAIVKGCYAYTTDKDYIAYMLVSGEIATTHIDDFIEWREIND